MYVVYFLLMSVVKEVISRRNVVNGKGPYLFNRPQGFPTIALKPSRGAFRDPELGDVVPAIG
jgi:hypothetical protein